MPLILLEERWLFLYFEKKKKKNFYVDSRHGIWSVSVPEIFCFGSFYEVDVIFGLFIAISHIIKLTTITGNWITELDAFLLNKKGF